MADHLINGSHVDGMGGDDIRLREDGEDQSQVKLFVGQVPRTMEENDVKPIFEEFGEVSEVVIIRDKQNGVHRGCAFVTYKHKYSADSAVAALHNKRVLPPNTSTLQVRPAEVQEHKLFIGMIPKSAEPDDIRAVFSRYGTIEEVYILRQTGTGVSKGCAFLKYETRESALAAIDAVHGNVTMEGGRQPLVVRFADNRRQRLQRQRSRSASGGYYPFNYNFPGMQHSPQHQYMQQMPGFGSQGGAASPGGAGSAAAPFLYYNPYQYGYGYPAAAASAAQQPYPFSPVHGAGGSGSSGPRGPQISTTSSPRLRPSSGPSASGTGPAPGQGGLGDVIPPGAKMLSSSKVLEGPQGANLFIYHLPHDLTDADLATAFAPFGSVISAKVFIDKSTGESKGFGFVSYDAPQAAEAAIASMNGFQIGSKRLKVQHKRINSNNISSSSLGGNGNGVLEGEEQSSLTESGAGGAGNGASGSEADMNVMLEQSVSSLRLDD